MRGLVILALLPLAACGSIAFGSDGTRSQPSGSGTQRSFAVSDFSAVDLKGIDDVVVTVGGGYQVRAEGASDELDALDIRRDGDTLRIGRVNSRLPWSSRKSVRVHVTLPAISAASVSGSGDMRVDRASGASFAGAVAGSGNLSIAALTAREVRLSVAGSGDLAASGRVDRLRASVAGSGDVSAAGLTASSANVSIAGSGDVAANVEGPATVSIAGSGDAVLGRKARCATSRVGSGSARCG